MKPLIRSQSSPCFSPPRNHKIEETVETDQLLELWNAKPKNGLVLKKQAALPYVEPNNFLTKSLKKVFCRHSFDLVEFRNQMHGYYLNACKTRKEKDAKKYCEAVKSLIEHFENNRSFLRSSCYSDSLSFQEAYAFLDASLFCQEKTNLDILMLSPVGCKLLGNDNLWPSLTLHVAKNWLEWKQPTTSVQSECCFWSVVIMTDAVIYQNDRRALALLENVVLDPKNRDSLGVSASTIALDYLHSKGFCSDKFKKNLPQSEVLFLVYQARYHPDEKTAEKALDDLARNKLANKVLHNVGDIASDSIHPTVAKKAFAYVKKYIDFNLMANQQLLQCLVKMACDKENPNQKEASTLLNQLKNPFNKPFLNKAKAYVRSAEKDLVHICALDDVKYLTLENLNSVGFKYDKPESFEEIFPLPIQKAVPVLKTIAEQKEFAKEARFALRVQALATGASNDSSMLRDLNWGAVLTHYNWLKKGSQESLGLFCGMALWGENDASAFALETMQGLRLAWLKKEYPHPVLKKIKVLLLPDVLNLLIFDYVFEQCYLSEFSDVQYELMTQAIWQQKI